MSSTAPQGLPVAGVAGRSYVCTEVKDNGGEVILAVPGGDGL